MTKLESVLMKWEEKLFITAQHNTIRNLQFAKVINQSLCREILFGSSLKKESGSSLHLILFSVFYFIDKGKILSCLTSITLT